MSESKEMAKAECLEGIEFMGEDVPCDGCECDPRDPRLKVRGVSKCEEES